MLKVGDAIPSFEVKNQNDEIIKSSDLLGKKLILFFYPKASTPTCTIEACTIGENYDLLVKNGYNVFGISADSVKRQNNFSTKYNFPYDLLADENHDIVKQFGVWKEKKNFGKTYMGIVRTTFIFDEKGICTRVIDKVDSKNAVQQILEG